MNVIKCRRCQHTNRDCRITRWKMKWGSDHQATDYICEHHFDPKYIMPKDQYYRNSFLTMDATPKELPGRPKPVATSTTTSGTTSNVTGDPARPSSATIKLSTNEVKFSERPIAVRCDGVELMTHGLFIKQMPFEADDGEPLKCVFISYREISKMQLSKAPTHESNYMFISVTPPRAQNVFEKFSAVGTFAPDMTVLKFNLRSISRQADKVEHYLRTAYFRSAIRYIEEIDHDDAKYVYNNTKPVSYMSMSVVNKSTASTRTPIAPKPVERTTITGKKSTTVNGVSSNSASRTYSIGGKIATTNNATTSAQRSNSIATLNTTATRVSYQRPSPYTTPNRSLGSNLVLSKPATTTMTSYSGRVFMPRKTSEEYILSDIMEYDSEKATFVTRIEADAERLIQQRKNLGSLKNQLTDLVSEWMEVGGHSSLSKGGDNNNDSPPDDLEVDEDSIRQATAYLDTKLRETYGDNIRINPVRGNIKPINSSSSLHSSPIVANRVSLTRPSPSSSSTTASPLSRQTNVSIIRHGAVSNLKASLQTLTNNNRINVTRTASPVLANERATVVINKQSERVGSSRRTVVLKSTSDEEKTQDSVIDGDDDGPPMLVSQTNTRKAVKEEEDDDTGEEEDQDSSDDSAYDGRGQKIHLAGKPEFKFNGKIYNSEADFDHAMKIFFEDCRQDYKVYQRSCAHSTMLPGHTKCKLTFNSILNFRDHIFQVNQLHFKCPNRPICCYNKRCMTQIQYKKHLYRCTRSKMLFAGTVDLGDRSVVV